MLITQVTVTYGETQSLPEYSNVKPSITLTAELATNDDPTEVEHQLWEWARTSVREQIDSALESNGRAAKYSAEPRYQVLRTYHDRYGNRGALPPPALVVILPNDAPIDRDALGVSLTHTNAEGEARKLRLAYAQRVAARAAAEHGAVVIDCSDGDLSKLAAALPPPEPERIEETPAPVVRVADVDDDYGDFDEDVDEDADDE